MKNIRVGISIITLSLSCLITSNVFADLECPSSLTVLHEGKMRTTKFWYANLGKSGHRSGAKWQISCQYSDPRYSIIATNLDGDQVQSAMAAATSPWKARGKDNKQCYHKANACKFPVLSQSDVNGHMSCSVYENSTVGWESREFPCSFN